MPAPAFEWFYIDMHIPDGHDLVVALHTRPFNSIFDIVICDVHLYKDNEVLLHEFAVRPRESLIRDETPFTLRCGDDIRFSREGGGVQLSIRDTRFDLDIDMENLLPGQAPLEAELLAEPAPGRSFRWIVHAPHCRGTATLASGGQSWRLKGTGYHDANDGTIHFKRDLERWTWGKYYLGDELLIYGEIFPRRGRRRDVLVHVTPDGAVLDDAPRIERQGDAVTLHSRVGEMELVRRDAHLIDDIRFYMATLPAALRPLAKAIEVAAHFPTARPALKAVQRRLTNVHYRRFRTVDTVNGKYLATAFHEEMLFT